MSGPVPNLTPRRWQADFRNNRAFVAGVPVPAPRTALSCVRAAVATAYDADGTAQTFAANVLRASNRGAVIEEPSVQLLSNSTLSGPDGQLPQGWRTNSGAVASDIVRSTYKGRPAITFTLSVTNSLTVSASYRLDLETVEGIAIPDGREAVFSGIAQVVSAVNASVHEARLIPRLAGGSATADQGRTPLAVGAPSPFKSLPAIDPSAVLLSPALTWVIAPSSVGVTRIMLVGPQVEPGTSPTSFMPRTPPLEVRTQQYPNQALAGAVAGDPGTAPPEWALAPAGAGATASARILAASGDTVDLQISATASSTAVTQDYYLSRLPGAGIGVIAAGPGEAWEAGFEVQVLAADVDATPRFQFSSRNSSGTALDSTTVNITSTSLSPVTRAITNTAAGTAAVVMLVRISVPAGTTKTVQLRIRQPSAQRVTTTPGSGAVERPLDVVSFSAPSVFSGATEMAIEAELDALRDDATLLSLRFASGYKLRLVAGTQVGIVVTPPSGPDVSTLCDLNVPPGIIRLALSWRPGQVGIAFSDVCERVYATLDVPGFEPATCTAAWLGSDNGQQPLTTAVRLIELRNGYTAANDLRWRTRDAWAPATFVQPRSGFAGADIETAAPYTPSEVVYIGPTILFGDLGNRFASRRNGGAAKNDELPHANSIGSTEGAPKRISVRNIDTAGEVRITSRGGLLYPYQGTIPYTADPVDAIVLQPGQRAFIISDCYNPVTGLWQAGNDNWWFVIRDSLDPLETNEFPSIYGPPSALNPNRAIIFPPNFCAYNADIGPMRAIATQITAAMNRWVRYRNIADAAHGMRMLRDLCATNYYYRSIGNTTITALKSQICTTGFAYLGLRDAGVGSAEDHRIIKAWFSDRINQSIAFFDAQTAAGAATARANHGQQAALAAAVCACILDRADLLRYAIAGYELVVNDSANTPGSVGACLLEMRRADKSLSYNCLAMTSIAALAEILERCGYPAYAFRNGHLLKMANFAAASIDTPALVTAEQARLLALPDPQWGAGVVSVDQQSIGFGTDTDPNTGDALPNESRVAFLFLLRRHYTVAQAPWIPLWDTRFGIYDAIYNGTIGGAQSYLYFVLGIALPDIPADA